MYIKKLKDKEDMNTFYNCEHNTNYPELYSQDNGK